MDLATVLRKPLVLQFIRFCIVGGIGMVVDMGTTAFFVEVVRLDPPHFVTILVKIGRPEFGAFFGFCLAVTNNYLLNRFWTFKAQANKGSAGASFVSFVAICTVGMFISIGVMHLAITHLNLQHGQLYLVARFIGIVVATLWNFVGSKLISFR